MTCYEPPRRLRIPRLWLLPDFGCSPPTAEGLAAYAPIVELHGDQLLDCLRAIPYRSPAMSSTA
jgi:hypothetical protein